MVGVMRDFTWTDEDEAIRMERKLYMIDLRSKKRKAKQDCFGIELSEVEDKKQELR